MNTKDIESLQRLRCKLGNALIILYEQRPEIRGELRLLYAVIHQAIIASIKFPAAWDLSKSKWKHVQQGRRTRQMEELQDAREWLMSNGPTNFWFHFTNESWEPVKDQLQKLWMEMSYLIARNGDDNNYANKLSNAVRKELYKVSDGR